MDVNEFLEKYQSVQSVGFTNSAFKPGLEGMLELDALMGHPSGKFRSVHVAGTNGKGSVSSMLAAALAAGGKRVGLYTSPHLNDFRERAKIVSRDCFEMVPLEYVSEFLDKYEPGFSGRSFFEITTALAFKWFADSKVDIAVIEVGLGGRMDSTNIITPELSVITSIGLDHCAVLGDTRAKIAAEKAGIIKPGVPAVIGFHDDETAPVFDAVAARNNATVHYVRSLSDKVKSYRLDLHGPYQDRNLSTVLLALEVMGIPADKCAIEQAAARTGLHGRWETLSTDPETICDIGHNPPALAINFAQLEKMSRPLVIVYGIMADKDLDSIAPMMPDKAQYILVAPDTARALPVADLQHRLKILRPELETCAAQNVMSGIEMALSMAENFENPLVYIGGSTFVVCEAIKYFGK